MISFLKSRWTATLVVSIFLPSFFLMLSLRIAELIRLNAVPRTVMASLASDTLVFMGVSTFTLGLLAAIPKWPKVVTAFGATLFLVLNLSEIISANFFLTTGSVLDFPVLLYGVEEIVNNWDVISSETPAWILMLTAGIFAFAWIIPWIFGALAEKKGYSAWAPKTSTLKYAFLGLLVGAGLTTIGALSANAAKMVAFARSSPIHLLDSAIQTLQSGVDSNLAYIPPTKIKRSKTKAPNIVFILMESTRASATSLYGPVAGTTPQLEKLAKQGIVMEHAYAVVPHTSKALVSTFCGFEPNLVMPITEASMGLPGDCLPELLDGLDYRTVFFQSATSTFENRKELVTHLGYEAFFPLEKLDKTGFAKVNYFGVEDLVMLKPSEAWLDTIEPDTPFLLTYLTVASHHSYDAPKKRYGRQPFAKPGAFNRYLNAVHSVDAFIGEVVEMLRQRKLMDNTILVILGDHGEGFGEHGRYQHDNVMYQEGVRIPFLIVDGRNPTPRRIPYATNQLDIFPTVINLAGISLRGGRYSGTDLLQLDEERTLFASCWYEKNCIASITATDKYIHNFGAKPDEYFLADDPEEVRDKASELSKTEVKRRVTELTQWRSVSLQRYITNGKSTKPMNK